MDSQKLADDDKAARTANFVAHFPTLFHYTTVEGLTGILKSNALRATHFRYLNDRTEVFHLKTALVPSTRMIILNRMREEQRSSYRVKRKIQELGGLHRYAEGAATEVINMLFDAAFSPINGRPPLSEPYIVSFCHHVDAYQKAHGLLSQWRGYSARGGFAIIFDTAKLVPLLTQEDAEFDYVMTPYMANAIYGDEEQRLAEEAPQLVTVIGDYAVNLLTGDQNPDTSAFLGQLLNTAPRFKHRAFHEENEVRLILCPTAAAVRSDMRRDKVTAAFMKEPVKPIKPVGHYSDKAGRQVPCIFFNEMPNAKKLPIMRVIVGPHNDQTGAEASVKGLLSDAGYDNRIVQRSDTPLVTHW